MSWVTRTLIEGKKSRYTITINSTTTATNMLQDPLVTDTTNKRLKHPGLDPLQPNMTYLARFVAGWQCL